MRADGDRGASASSATVASTAAADADGALEGADHDVPIYDEREVRGLPENGNSVWLSLLVVQPRASSSRVRLNSTIPASLGGG